MLSLEGWIDGLTATFIVFFLLSFGSYHTYKSKKLSIKLLTYLSVALIFSGLIYTYHFLDFIAILMTSKNIENTFYIVPIVGWIWLAPVTLLGMYIAGELLFPKKKLLLLLLYIVFAIIYEVILVLDIQNSMTIIPPIYSGERLLFAQVILFSPFNIMELILIGSLFFIFGLGFLIKSINSPFKVKRKYRYLAFGDFLLTIFITLDGLTKYRISILIISYRIAIILGAIFFYLALKPEKIDKRKKEIPSEEIIKLTSYMLGKPKTKDYSELLNASNVVSKEKLLVFISYATKDVDTFKVHDVAKKLTEFPEIENVLYWEEHMEDNIFEYMDENLDKCDAMILFCSEHARDSIPVKKEWTAAEALGKPIIPVFYNPNHIPALLSSRLGINYDFYDMERNIQELHSLILKKLGGLTE